MALFWVEATVHAQNDEPEAPVYVVQEGDSLFEIAVRFGISLDRLIEANQIANPNQLLIGDRLVIPGLEGVRGVLTTEPMPLGENLTSLSRKYQIPVDLLTRLNRISSPSQLYLGSQVVLPVRDGEVNPRNRSVLRTGESALEMAARLGDNPWALAGRNGLPGIQHVLPADILLTNGPVRSGPGALPPGIIEAVFDPLPLRQGEMAAIEIAADDSLTVTGTLSVRDLRSEQQRDYPLVFYPQSNEKWIALQGIHVMARSGLYPLSLEVSDSEGDRYQFMQMVPVVAGNFIRETINVDPSLLDPDLTRAETEFVLGLMQSSRPTKMWEGSFLSPSPFPDCITSSFGNRRSYNGSAFVFYHGGVDFCGGTGIEIFAPAGGEVIFAGPLEVRGNFTLIDHGWGVYTAYLHQSEIFVERGDLVEPGQTIGLVGGTGRVTGAHLHWEVWVGSVQVRPLDWLESSLP